MSMKFNLFLILIVALIAFAASSTQAAPLNFEKRHHIKEKKKMNNDNNKNKSKNKVNDNVKFKGNDVCKDSKLDKGDGTQDPKGFCVDTVMGEIPDADNMISTLITNPIDGSTIKANKNFVVETVTDNLISGFFSDAAKEYYVKPQQLQNGKILGHSHVTIQELKGDRKKPLNPKVFAFFKGLNEPAKDGVLSVTVNNGLPAGDYRICTIVSSFTHQPVLMPIAQRGSQDDCIRIKVR